MYRFKTLITLLKKKWHNNMILLFQIQKEAGLFALSQSVVTSSIILNPFSNLPFHDNSDATGDSAKSVIPILHEFFICLVLHPYLDYFQSELLLYSVQQLYLTRFQFLLGPLITQRFSNCFINHHLMKKIVFFRNLRTIFLLLTENILPISL